MNARRITPEECPLIADQVQIEELSADMAAALRQMRSDMQYCDHCSIDPGECLILKDLNQAVGEALAQIGREWDLVHSIKPEES
jgi:hypothetical protein